MDPSQFRRACAKFATGVAIATITGPGGVPHGMTINSFTSVSLDPPLVLICSDRSGNLASMFRECNFYGVNVLSQSQRELSNRFALRGHDRFDGVEWRAGRTGVPLIAGCLAWFECEVKHRVESGDHTILVAEVLDAGLGDGKPLLYFESGYRSIA